MSESFTIKKDTGEWKLHNKERQDWVSNIVRAKLRWQKENKRERREEKIEEFSVHTTFCNTFKVEDEFIFEIKS